MVADRACSVPEASWETLDSLPCTSWLAPVPIPAWTALPQRLDIGRIPVLASLFFGVLRQWPLMASMLADVAAGAVAGIAVPVPMPVAKALLRPCRRTPPVLAEGEFLRAVMSSEFRAPFSSAPSGNSPVVSSPLLAFSCPLLPSLSTSTALTPHYHATMAVAEAACRTGFAAVAAGEAPTLVVGKVRILEVAELEARPPAVASHGEVPTWADATDCCLAG